MQGTVLELKTPFTNNFHQSMGWLRQSQTVLPRWSVENEWASFVDRWHMHSISEVSHTGRYPISLEMVSVNAGNDGLSRRTRRKRKSQSTQIEWEERLLCISISQLEIYRSCLCCINCSINYGEYDADGRDAYVTNNTVHSRHVQFYSLGPVRGPGPFDIRYT